MRTYARLEALRDWTYETVCRGRRMKKEPPNRDITEFIDPVEPAVHIAYPPKRFDESLDTLLEVATHTAPSIIIMPTISNVKYVEPLRFDQYKGVHRPQEYGQQLNVQVLFTVYEDGLRLPGFIDEYEEHGKFELSLLREGTQEGLQALLDWMDEYEEALLTQQNIPKSDLILMESNFVYNLRIDQKSITDNRPLYYGFCEIGFACIAESGENPEIAALLD